MLHFTDYQRSSPPYSQLINRTSISNCSPSPCDRFSRSRTTTRAPPVHRASGPHSLFIAHGPSPVHMSDSNARVRLPVAIFNLACRKSMQTPRDSYARHAVPGHRPTYTMTFSERTRTCSQLASTFHRISRVGEGEHFSPQTRINRFVFLNLPMLSLETHLGLTTSPHAPFPTGFVTLPMCNRSPPLRLSLAHSSERTIDERSPSLSSCIPDMLRLRQHLPDASRGWAR